MPNFGIHNSYSNTIFRYSDSYIYVHVQIHIRIQIQLHILKRINMRDDGWRLDNDELEAGNQDDGLDWIELE